MLVLIVDIFIIEYYCLLNYCRLLLLIIYCRLFIVDTLLLTLYDQLFVVDSYCRLFIVETLLSTLIVDRYWLFIVDSYYRLLIVDSSLIVYFYRLKFLNLHQEINNIRLDNKNRQ